MFKKIILMALFIFCVVAAINTSVHAGNKPVFIGITAKDDAVAQKDYSPFLSLLAKELKCDVTLKTFPDLVKLGESLKSGKIQFTILSPTDYLKMHETVGVEAIATKLNKGGTPFCQGTIISAKNGNINKLIDLKGKPFCFGPDGSFNKYYAALTAFKTEGLTIKDVDPLYGKSCSNIAGHILEGKSVAGVICDYSWNGWEKKLKEDPKTEQPSSKLKVIGVGPKLRDKAIAASKTTAAELRKKFVAALLTLKGKPEILKPPLKAKGFAASTDKDYDSLRKIIKEL